MNKLVLMSVLLCGVVFQSVAMATMPIASDLKKSGTLCPADAVLRQGEGTVALLQNANLVKRTFEQTASGNCNYEISFQVPEGTRLKLSKVYQSYLYKLTKDATAKVSLSVSVDNNTVSTSKEVSETNRLASPVTKVGNLSPDFSYSSECYKEGPAVVKLVVKNLLSAEGLLDVPVNVGTFDFYVDADLEDCH